jgi:hypothetical protein
MKGKSDRSYTAEVRRYQGRKNEQHFLREGIRSTVPTSTMTSELYGSVLEPLPVTPLTTNETETGGVYPEATPQSYAARAMGIEAVEMKAPLCPGRPLCKAYAPGSPIDGLEIIVKGGRSAPKIFLFCQSHNSFGSFASLAFFAVSKSFNRKER